MPAPKPKKKPPSEIRLAALQSLGKDLSAALILAFDSKNDKETEELCWEIAQKASAGKVVQLLVDHEEHAEWIAMGLAAGIIIVIKLRALTHEMFFAPKPKPGEPPKEDPNAKTPPPSLPAPGGAGQG